MDEQTKGRIASIFIPSHFLLGEKLGEWYEKNPYHKFDKGDILIFRGKGTWGYGVRPVAVVNGYETRADEFEKAGRYDVTMYKDEGGYLFPWMIPQGDGRIVSKHEIHFKWNSCRHCRTKIKQE